MKAVLYAHIKPEEQPPSCLSIADQIQAVLEYAERVGLDILDAYQDDPVAPIRELPELLQCSRSGVAGLLDKAEKAEWIYVVAAAEDRLDRSDLGLNLREELEAIGKSIALVGDEFNLPEPEAKPARRKAQLTVAERLLRGREAGARAGMHQSGPAPYGYLRDYSERKARGVRLRIHPEEAEVVRTIFKEYLRRKSIKRLIEFLDAQGLTTRRFKQWSRPSVAWILKNETYLGRVHFGRIRAKGKHPAIISPITFNKVQALLRKNNKRGGKKKAGPR